VDFFGKIRLVKCCAKKFENEVLVPTSVADGFLQYALAVGDLQDQPTQ
jgi:hypothetical protein